MIADIVFTWKAYVDSMIHRENGESISPGTNNNRDVTTTAVEQDDMNQRSQTPDIFMSTLALE